MDAQTDLPGFTLRLNPFPGETLFSWCSRYHRLSANGRDGATCLQLFGDRRIGTAHDFPARLDALVHRSRGAIGDATSIIKLRTILPYYLPFRSARLSDLAQAAMRGSGIGSLKYQLGLLTSGLGASHPLRFCAQCIAADLRQHGWAIWHRDHQLPGTWVCVKHREVLRVSPCKLNQRARFAWALPSLNGDENFIAHPQYAYDPNLIRWLIKLATMSAELVRLDYSTFDDPTRLGIALRRRLIELELANSAGRVRWRHVDPTLEMLAKHQAALPEMQHLADKALLKGQLIRALSGRSATHPLRWLLWCSVWFKDLSALDAAYRDATQEREKLSSLEGPTVSPPIVRGALQARLFSSVGAGETSMTDAARQAGVSYNTIAFWACQHGVEATCRPKKLSPHMRQLMVSGLEQGCEKHQLASDMHMSVETVTRVLRTTPGLQKRWHQARFDLRRATARAEWLRLRQGDQGLSTKAARKLSPATYAWLYRNDLQWLKDSVTTGVTTLRGNHAKQKQLNAQERRKAATISILSRQEALWLA